MMKLIWSFEHNGWWKPAGYGYTSILSEAGRYTEREAMQIVSDANRITVNEQLVDEADAATFTPPPSFVCPRCRRRSFNLNDISERYCGVCHRFGHDPPRRRSSL